MMLLVPLLVLAGSVFAQLPVATHIQILRAEDSRRYDAVLEALMKSPNAPVRMRAALAAGRIGDAAAVPALVRMLNDSSEKVREMAAFALGETESIEAADAVRIALGETARAQMPGAERANVRGHLVEAAGKIAAANAQHAKAKELGETIKFILAAEKERPTSIETARLALTAALRARPAGADENIRFFLSHTDPGVVSDALNTLSRLRAKNANRDARDLLETHTHAVVRANAARLLGAAEDKEAVDLLIKGATTDTDSRVRVSAIRSLSAIRDKKAVEPLMARGTALLNGYRRTKKPTFTPLEKSEFLEIATALGRILEKSGDARVVKLLSEFRKLDGYESTEVASALAQVSPNDFFTSVPDKEDSVAVWKQFRSTAAGMSQLAKLEDKGRSLSHANQSPEAAVREMLGILSRDDMKKIGRMAIPDFLQTYAEFKPDDLEETLREQLASEDVFVRAAVAELLAANFPSQATRRALEKAFDKALTTDKKDNDAQLALLDAMAKVDAAGAVDTIYKALDSPDYLVRKRAFALLEDPKLLAAYPGAANVARDARARHKDKVWPYDPKSGTKLGQVLNKDADYRRALSRKNGTVRAVFTTQKGKFAIEFRPEDAPLTVDNFVKLARSGYFNGLEVHRVVPNFVMQDGDPLGNGSGGPGWSIRCEMNMAPFERGAVGMALSGKDTGGSQWFVTHSPQPHLDGGYTVFGRVNETGMKVVDRIVRGDKIVSVRIVGR